MLVDLRLRDGIVRGVRSNAVDGYLGIPYAAPPFGTNRFLDPQPVAAWADVRDATSYGPAAPKPPQPPVFERLLPDASAWGDDCLTLNVWSPADRPAVRMPVLVWIHGGGYVTGSGAVPIYDGSSFARNGVVAVTINYRLGVDGFAQLEGAVPNRGLLDMVAALRWVQDNIDAFGGDPSQVTIAGQSAGAMAVLALLSMPMAQGLFRRAAAFSGSGGVAASSALAAQVAEELASLLGVEPTAAAFASVELGRLIASADALSSALGRDADTRWAELRQVVLPLCPEIDGVVLPVRPIDGIAAGVGADVDLLIGTTRDEFTLWTVPTGIAERMDEQTLRADLTSRGVDPDRVMSAYRSVDPAGGPARWYDDIQGDFIFRVPSIRVAEARTARGALTYVYEFAHPVPVHDGRMGATHASDVAYWFDNLHCDWDLALRGPAAPHTLADEMHAALLSFLRHGDAGWTPYGVDRNVRIFAERGSAVIRDPRAVTREVWAGTL